MSNTLKAAVDLGTTTIAAYLIQLTGKGPSLEESASYNIIGETSGENPQRDFGKDVISRISYIGEDKERLRKLQKLAADQCRDLLDKLCDRAGCKREEIHQIVFAGNPTMCHILLGYLPIGLAGSPFSHQYKGSYTGKGDELGLRGYEQTEVYIFPAIGEHVGGDTVAAMTASLSDTEGKQMLIDIGTNGEIVLEKAGEYFACSAAAGPALEGGEIHQGMIAEEGAITSVVWEKEKREWKIDWVGRKRGVKPKGICGSGLIDAVVALKEAGVIDKNGRILTAEEAKKAGVSYSIAKRLVTIEKQQAVVLYIERETMLSQAKGIPELFVQYIQDKDTHVVMLTQEDIRAVQLAKGALYAAMKILLRVAGLEAGEIERVYVAGAFGNYIRVESAIGIGLFPEEWREKIIQIGNAAGTGCCQVAARPSKKEWAEKIPKRIRHIPLGNSKVFQEYYLEAMNFC